MATDDLNYKNLDPGIRETVRWLRSHGFETTDSGDGVSKPDIGRVLDEPHVFMDVSPLEMKAQADRLLRLCREAGVRKPRIEVAYSPIDGRAVLMLFAVR